MKDKLIIEILNKRTEELKKDIIDFTARELNATTESAKVYYGYRVAEARQLLDNLGEAQKCVADLHETLKAFFKALDQC